MSITFNVFAQSGCTDAFACNYNNQATEDDGSCNFECISPEVVCPSDKEIFLCVPNTTPPPLELKDFIPSGNRSLLDGLLFNPEQSDGVNPDFTLTIYSYVIEDSQGNQRACVQRYYNTTKPIDNPQIDPVINICEDDFWSFVRKPLLDDYRFYTDVNGSPGELLNICEFPYSFCPTWNYGFNTSKASSHKFWVTSFIRFTDEEFCESIPMEVNLKVNSKPTVSLNERSQSLGVGQYINLMGVVSGDQSGVWHVKDPNPGLISFNNPLGETLYYFAGNKEGAYKLYYRVGNDLCAETLVFVVNVVAVNNRFSNKLVKDILTIYPNPSSGTLFVDLPFADSINGLITISNIKGQKQLTFSDDQLFEPLDLSALPKGIYFVELRSEMFNQVQKLILR